MTDACERTSACKTAFVRAYVKGAGSEEGGREARAVSNAESVAGGVEVEK